MAVFFKVFLSPGNFIIPFKLNFKRQKPLKTKLSCLFIALLSYGFISLAQNAPNIAKADATAAAQNNIAEQNNPKAANKQSFSEWLRQFKEYAKSQGIKEEIIKDAFAGVKAPDNNIFHQARHQPEFTISAEQYLNRNVTKSKINKGVKLAEKWHDWLVIIEKRFKVPAPYLLAIWSMESNYGAVFHNNHRLKYAISALASLAYGDEKRRAYASKQLIAALKILQNGNIGKEQLLGSWAGALGQTQFIPTSYLKYGIDIDNDGKIDIWQSVPDALASAANLLQQNGWQEGQSWGFEVMMPAHFKNFKNQESHDFNFWHDQHLRKINGQRVEPGPEMATLKIFAGEKGTAFLLKPNFAVFKAYNKSDLYALAVGLLGDAIAMEQRKRQNKAERANNAARQN